MLRLPESLRKLNRTKLLSVMALTLVRIPLAVMFAALYKFSDNSMIKIWGGIILLIFIEVSDALDGFLARKFQVVSELGAMFDPYTDSLSRLIVYYTYSVNHMVFMAVPMIMAIRDVTVAYCRIILTRSNKSVAALLSGKIKAIIQGFFAFALCLSPLVVNITGRNIYPIISWIVIIATLASCLEYIAAAYKSVSE